MMELGTIMIKEEQRCSLQYIRKKEVKIMAKTLLIVTNNRRLHMITSFSNK